MGIFLVLITIVLLLSGHWFYAVLFLLTMGVLGFGYYVVVVLVSAVTSALTPEQRTAHRQAAQQWQTAQQRQAAHPTAADLAACRALRARQLAEQASWHKL